MSTLRVGRVGFSWMSCKNEDYNVYLAKRTVRRILGDCVARKEPITTEILFKLFSQFDFNNHLHVCMHALFLVAFFSFLRQYIQFSSL